MELLDFPQALATQFGIPLFAGQILASIIFLMFPLLPTLVYTGGKGYTGLIVGIASLGFCVALGWFPIWTFAIICLMLALMYGKSIIGIFGGD